MTQIALYDYASLPTDLASELRDHAEEIRSAAVRIMDQMIVAGAHLAMAQDAMARRGNGDFQAWVERETPVSVRTAYDWISVYRNIGEEVYARLAQTDRLPDRKTLYALAAPSTPPEVREAVIQKVEAGESVTVREVDEAKRQATAAKREAQEQRERAAQMQEQMDQQSQAANEEHRKLISDLTHLEETKNRLSDTIRKLEARPTEVRTVEKIPDGFKNVAEAIVAAKKELADLEQQRKLKEADLQEIRRKAAMAESESATRGDKLNKLIAFNLRLKTLLADTTEAQLLMASDVMTDPIRQELGAIVGRLNDLTALGERMLGDRRMVTLEATR